MKNQISLLAGLMLLATPALAADELTTKLGGKMATYFGSSSTTGSTSSLMNINEANINFKASQGPLSVYFELENRNGVDNKIVSQRYAKYEREGVSLQIGTVISTPTISFSTGGGAGTTQLATDAAGYSGLTNKTEADGLALAYAMSPELKLSLTMHDTAAFNAYAAGTTTIIGLEGKVGDLEYRVASHSEDETANSYTATGTHVGVKYTMGDLDFNINQASQTVTAAATTEKTDASAQIGFKVNDTQKAILTLASVTTGTTDTSVTMFVYDFKLAPNLGSMQVVYASNATGATTKSYTGLGFNAGF